LFEGKLTKDDEIITLIPKFSFQGGYYPLKLCNGARLQVKHLRTNIIEATILTIHAK
jgi:hypothetical protein